MIVLLLATVIPGRLPEPDGDGASHFDGDWTIADDDLDDGIAEPVPAL